MDWTTVSFGTRRVIYLVSVAIVTFLIGIKLDVTSGYYLWLTAWLLALLPIQGSLKKHLGAMVLAGICMLLVTIISSFMTVNIILYALTVSLICFLCLYFGEKRSIYVIPLVYIVVYCIIAQLLSHSTTRIDASIGIVLGVIIAVCLYALYIPGFHRHRWEILVYRLSEQVRGLLSAVFDCFLMPDYTFAIYSYERRLHVKKMLILTTFVKIAKENNYLSDERKSEITDLLERLVSSMYEMSLLRVREEDHSTFQLCESELIAVKKSLEQSLLLLGEKLFGKHVMIDLSILSICIERLSDQFSEVLQVSAKDPVIYSYFIASMNECRDLLNRLVKIAMENDNAKNK